MPHDDRLFLLLLLPLVALCSHHPAVGQHTPIWSTHQSLLNAHACTCTGTVTHTPDGGFSHVMAVDHRLDKDPVLEPLLCDARNAWTTHGHPGWRLAGATTDEVLVTGQIMVSAAEGGADSKPGVYCVSCGVTSVVERSTCGGTLVLALLMRS